MIGRVSRRTLLTLGGAAALAPVLAACGAMGEPAGIYIVPVSGAPRWIGSGTGAPAWSPDGAGVAWGDESGLWLWRHDTGSSSRIVDTRVVARAAWSPDGSSIAFIDATTATLQRVGPDGANRTPLATIADHAAAGLPPLMQQGGPAWSPDGKTIAFVCWDGGGDELCLVDAEGNRRQELTSLGPHGVNGEGAPASSSVVGMAWSPDSMHIAVGVQAEQRGATAGVFLVALAPRTGRRISTLVPNAPLSWPATSDAVLFSAVQDGRSTAFLLDPVTRDAVPLTAALPDPVRYPVMSDSGELAVLRGDALVLVDSAGARDLPVNSLAASSPAWNPAGDELVVVASQTPIQNYR